MPRRERRSDLVRRRRIDELLAIVGAARAEIVATGLDAVHDRRAAGRRFVRTPPGGAGDAAVSALRRAEDA